MVRYSAFFVIAIIFGWFAIPRALAEQAAVIDRYGVGVEALVAEREPVPIPMPGGIEWFYGLWKPLRSPDNRVIRQAVMVPGSFNFLFHNGNFQQQPYFVVDSTDRMVLLGLPKRCGVNTRFPEDEVCISLVLFAAYRDKRVYRDEIMMRKQCYFMKYPATGLDMVAIRREAEGSRCGDILHRNYQTTPDDRLFWMYGENLFARFNKLGFPSDPLPVAGQ